MELVITETTVAEVSGIRVAVGNVWEDEYTQSDGTESVRPGATLYVMGNTPETDFDVRVYEGLEVEIGVQKVRIKNIYAPPRALGRVTLEFLD